MSIIHRCVKSEISILLKIRTGLRYSPGVFAEKISRLNQKLKEAGYDNNYEIGDIFRDNPDYFRILAG
jgi:hypothetical protein